MLENFNNLSRQEILQQKANAETLAKEAAKALKKRAKKDQFDFKKEVKIMAKDRGFGEIDLIFTKTQKAKTNAKPKYRHPNDHLKTWTGKGRTPDWMINHLKQGGKKDELLIS